MTTLALLKMKTLSDRAASSRSIRIAPCGQAGLSGPTIRCTLCCPPVVYAQRRDTGSTRTPHLQRDQPAGSLAPRKHELQAGGAVGALLQLHERTGQSSYRTAALKLGHAAIKTHADMNGIATENITSCNDDSAMFKGALLPRACTGGFCT